MKRKLEIGATVTACAAVLWGGASFGFFFAWVCSTLWGLDTLDPRIAIEAMNSMNLSVRNPVFFTAFFLTPVVALIAAVACITVRARSAAILFGLVALAHAFGVILVTQALNLPLNEALAVGGVPDTTSEAAAVWQAYSAQWQTANLLRTIVSGLVLATAAAACVMLGRVLGRNRVTASQGVPAAD